MSATDREISFSRALNEALREEMRRDSRVFILGEDIGRLGGLFKVTDGLLQEFGSDRVIDTPISEAAIAGAGLGSALVGMRPVIEFQFMDFMTIAMDQIVNHAAKIRYMTGGQASAPMVIRAPICGGVNLGAQHSQSLEAWFVHIPGLKVVMPSAPVDAKGLLKSAIRDDNPVLFLEHRLLYGQTGPVPSEEYLIPLTSGAIKRSGTDMTVVATGRTVNLALTAAEKLAAEGIEIEVVDPRTLKPLDASVIERSIKKTSRAVILSDGNRMCGYGAELAATIAESCFFDLDAPVKMVCGRDVPMPVAPLLQRAVMVSEEDLLQTCRALRAA
jgi:acetoin:2,6-dichlorophenolindophenol oxidoreductase subunit beta